MNVKALLVFVLVLIVVSFATEGEANSELRKRKKIQSKREYKVSFKIITFFFLGVSSKFSLDKGLCSCILPY